MVKDKSVSSGNKGADFFLVKFWTQILNNPTCKHITSWSEDGRYLIIYDTEALMDEIKGRSVCKQKDYDSFARQLRIYRWGRCRVDDTGASPWPSDAKVWRHPILNRESPLDDVANITRNAPPKPNRAQLANPELMTLLDASQAKKRVKAAEDSVAEGSPQESPVLSSHIDPALFGGQSAGAMAVPKPTLPVQAAPAPPRAAPIPAPHYVPPKSHKKGAGLAAQQARLAAAAAGVGAPMPVHMIGIGGRRVAVGFHGDDGQFGGIGDETDSDYYSSDEDEDLDDLLQRSSEAAQVRLLTRSLERANVGPLPGPRAPEASVHLAKIDLTKVPPAELRLPPIPPVDMATRDFPRELYFNSNIVLEHAAANPMNFDHPWAALSQTTKMQQRMKQAQQAAQRYLQQVQKKQEALQRAAAADASAADPATAEAGAEQPGQAEQHAPEDKKPATVVMTGDIRILPSVDITPQSLS